LEATQRGTVTRTCATARDRLPCPAVGDRAIWSILEAGLIANGPKNGDRIQMILTPKGEVAIAATAGGSLAASQRLYRLNTGLKR
jgi:hypothetical protein